MTRSENTSGCHNWQGGGVQWEVTGIQGLEARDAAKHLPAHRAASITNGDLLQGLPQWSRACESTLQCRGHRLDPWLGN